MKTSRLLLLCAVLAAPAFAAHAARPFVTDDARLTTAGSCQLESWMRIYPHSREGWALPACNPTGNLEFTVGGGSAHNDGERATHDHVYQLKTLFRPLEANGWGWGLALGKIQHPSVNPGPNQFGSTYAYVPLSVAFADDKLILHSNLGWLKEKITQRQNTTWGIGAEYKLTGRLLGIAETFGDARNRPYWQLGGRYNVVPEKVQIDATLGQQFDGLRSGRWISFGLRLTPESLW